MPDVQMNIKRDSFDSVLDALVEWATKESLVRSLWIEGATLRDVRRPYTSRDVHVCADEPAFPELLEALPKALQNTIDGEVVEITDTERFAKCHEVRAGEHAFSLIVEQSNLLAKRPRAEVIPLVDKTTHLPHVLDYSLRRR